MHALFPVLAVLGLASAQETYTVWSTVLFLRTGDRSPLTSANVPTTLTPLGAQQMHSVGNFFRERYITSSTGNASYDAAPLQGLSASVPQDAQMYLLALDTQYTAASAQAFMQGLYPPYSLNSTAASESTGTDLNELGFLGNGSYVSALFVVDLLIFAFHCQDQQSCAKHECIVLYTIPVLFLNRHVLHLVLAVSLALWCCRLTSSSRLNRH